MIDDSTLLLSQKQVKALLDMPSVIDIVEKVFRWHDEAKVIFPPKLTLDLGESQPWPPYHGFVNAMPAYIGELDVAGIKWVGGFQGNPANGLPYISALILLMNPRNGLFTAVIEGAYITALRTGAASAIFAKYLARNDSTMLAVLGAGVQGRMQLRAMSIIFNFEEVRVTDIDRRRAEEYAREMTEELGLNVRVANSCEAAIAGADIVCTVTSSTEPLVKKAWLKEGSLVIGCGSHQELESEVILTANKIVVDNWAQASHRGALAAVVGERRLSESQIYGEIGSIVTGRKSGRASASEHIVAVPVGLGSADVACAHEALRRALARGVGDRFQFVKTMTNPDELRDHCRQ
jgi:ornithine cyclodeaminase/alanine dehydrogenase